MVSGGGTPSSRRVQSCGFSRRRVACIMHAGCYFHHMVLSGVIVVPAPSAHTGFIDCSFGVHFNPLLLAPFLPHSPVKSLSYGAGAEGPLGSINCPCLQSGGLLV